MARTRESNMINQDSYISRNDRETMRKQRRWSFRLWDVQAERSILSINRLPVSCSHPHCWHLILCRRINNSNACWKLPLPFAVLGGMVFWLSASSPFIPFILSQGQRPCLEKWPWKTLWDKHTQIWMASRASLSESLGSSRLYQHILCYTAFSPAWQPWFCFLLPLI